MRCARPIRERSSLCGFRSRKCTGIVPAMSISTSLWSGLLTCHGATRSPRSRIGNGATKCKSSYQRTNQRASCSAGRQSLGSRVNDQGVSCLKRVQPPHVMGVACRIIADKRPPPTSARPSLAWGSRYDQCRSLLLRYRERVQGRAMVL
jgi:hypothetical protein